VENRIRGLNDGIFGIIEGVSVVNNWISEGTFWDKQSRK